METKNYRLSAETLHQLAWLQQRFGVTQTDVVRMGVAGLFAQERAKLPLAQLVETPGGYVLESQGNAVLEVGSGAVAGLPEHVRAQLKMGSADVGDAFTYLVLSAARAGEEISWSRTGVGEVLVEGGKD